MKQSGLKFRLEIYSANIVVQRLHAMPNQNEENCCEITVLTRARASAI